MLTEAIWAEGVDGHVVEVLVVDGFLAEVVLAEIVLVEDQEVPPRLPVEVVVLFLFLSPPVEHRLEDLVVHLLVEFVSCLAVEAHLIHEVHLEVLEDHLEEDVRVEVVEALLQVLAVHLEVC